MRRAEWRRRADDPTGLFGWWWRVVGERRLLLATLPFGMCVLVSIAGGGLGWFILAAANFVFVMGRPTKVDPLAPLLPDPPPPGQFRATAKYRREGIVIGRDEVALTLVDGWLVGEGVRSSFALRSSDGRRPSNWRENVNRQERLVLTDGSEILLHGVIAHSVQARGTIERWRRAKPAGGEPTFPPARAYPKELARWAARWMSTPCLFLLMPLARLLYASEEAYVASLAGILLSFLALSAWSAKNFLGLIRIENEALKDAEKALSERVQPIDGSRAHPFAGSRPETRTSAVELPDVQAR